MSTLLKLSLLAACLFVKIGGEVQGCEDADPKCGEWATQGECTTNAVWMMANCRKSCRSCQGGEKAWKLRSFIASNYKNDTNDNQTKRVNIESVRLNMVDINEERQTAKVSGRMVMSWNDTGVAWDKERWGLSWLNFYWVQIWSPQIIQINGASTGGGTVTSKVLAANSTGQIYLWADFTFTSPFQFEYGDYPNDYQQICYKFDDKRLFAVHFTVAPEVKSKEREELSATHVSGWIVDDLQLNVQESPLSSISLSDWRRNPFDVQSTNGEMCVGLRRNAVYFFSEMFLPALLSAMFTLSAVFFRLSRTQSLLLAFSVVCQLLSLLLISQRLPSYTAHTPDILKFAGFNMVMTALLFICSLILERLSSTPSDIPPPHSVSNIVGMVHTVLPLPKSKDSEVPLPWAPFSHALNHLIFVAATFCYLFAFFYCFVI